MPKQIIKVAPSSTEVSVEITLPDVVPVVQSGATPIQNQPPIAGAGTDQTITLPTNSTTLVGNGIDSDGNVVSFAWVKVSGGAALIAEANRATTVISNLVQGVYVFRLTVTDNKSATGSDDITVTVSAGQPANQPPQVSAGQDVTITLPTNSVNLDGTASDPDGTIVSSVWTKLSGGAATIVSPTSIDTQVTGLAQGSYTFQLEVTDDKGAKTKDTAVVTVNAVVVPPTPSAYEGFGAQAVGGGNSSTVYHVTNLNSSGSGSLSAGIGSNKTIVFDVSGTITGRFDLINISYLTIDATGRDITINNANNGDGISFDGSNTHHCILKGVRVINAGNDGINVVDGAHDIVITNCSSYDNVDGNIDVAGGKNVSIQWCILGRGKQEWSGDMLITAQNVTAHHNLFAPATQGGVGERAPLVHSSYTPPGSPSADVRNNLVWKFGRDNGTGSGFGIDSAYGATTNAVNNYVYTTGGSASAGVTTSAYGEPSGLLYAVGNVSGNSGTNANSKNNHAEWAIPAWAQVTVKDACTAAREVIQKAGPTTRNSIEQAIINGITLPGC